MTQNFNDNLYLIDLSYLNTPAEMVYDLSSILDTEPARNQRVKLNLGSVDFNKSQLLSIKSLIESINSTLAIVEGKSEVTKNSAITIGLVYQNVEENITVPTEQNIEEQIQENEVPRFEITPEEMNFANNKGWMQMPEISKVQNMEEEFSNNNWANPQGSDGVNSENVENKQEERINELFDNQSEQVEFEEQIIVDNEEVQTNEEEIIQSEEIGIQSLADIPLDIPNDKTIQEELDVIYGAERKLDDVFANTGLKGEKFQALKDTPKAEEKEYTQYDFELEAFPTKYLKQTICAGQYISFDGNLVIIGDCHEGSEISASGDITVWGELSGSAHAGKNGNEKCKIRTLKMNASQLRIANCYVKRPTILNNTIPESIPEEAMISNGEIVVYKIYK